MSPLSASWHPAGPPKTEAGVPPEAARVHIRAWNEKHTIAGAVLQQTALDCPCDR